MKKRVYGIGVLGFFLILGSFLSGEQGKMAKAKYVSNMVCDNKVKIGGITLTAKQYKAGVNYKYKLTMKKGKKTKVITKDSTCAFVTNGKVIYYAEQGALVSDYEHKNVIYKYVVKTGKASVVLSEKEGTVLGCSGKYLYYGRDYEADGVNVYAFNLKTSKKKHMVNTVGTLSVAGKKVVTSTNAGDAGNYPIHTFNLDGSGKKKIVNGGLLKVKSQKIYYVRFKNSVGKVRVYCCKLNGKGKKALTEWVETIPEKFR